MCSLRSIATLLIVALLGRVSVTAAETVAVNYWPGYKRGPAKDVVVRNNLAYVACRAGGLQILDVSDPKNIRRVGGYGLDDSRVEWAELLAVSGNYVALVTSMSAVRIIDVSDPTKPQLLSSFNEGQIPIAGVATDGNYVYIARRYGADPDQFQIWDISNPSQPTRVSQMYVPEPRMLTLDEGFAFLGSDNGVYIVDARDPLAPKLAAAVYVPRICDAMAVSGNYAYATTWINDGSGPSKLNVIDITDRFHPTNIASVTVTNVPTGLAVLGSHVCVTDRNGAIELFDVSNPSNPTRAGYYYMPPVSHTVSGGFETSKPFLVDNMMFIAANDAGVAILDMADPLHPQRIGKYETSGWSGDVVMRGTTAFVADGHAGLQILNLQNPNAPVHLAQWLADGGTNELNSVFIDGSYAFVTDGAAGLRILDISNLAKPVLVGAVELGGAPLDIVVSGGYAFIANWNLGLQIVDVSSVSNPKKVGQIASTAFGSSVEVYGNYAYLGLYGSSYASKGVEVFDVREPTNPKLVTGVLGATMYPGLARIGSTLFFSDDFGIEAVDISTPQTPTSFLAITNTSKFSARGATLYTLLRLGGTTFSAYDARNPARITPLWTATLPQFPIYGMDVEAGRAAAAVGSKGVALFAIPALDVSLDTTPATLTTPFKIRLHGPAGVTGRLQRATSLDAWQDWQTVTINGDSVEVIDPETTETRFYRFLSP